MTDRTRPELGQSAEDYLKAIFKLRQGDEPVATNTLADALRVTPAAVTKAMGQLAKKRLVNHRPYHGVSLTRGGRRAALSIIRRHRLLEQFLHDVLGYGWDEVDAEAEQLEHHVSEEFVARVDRLLNYPSIDPHGDPIPSHDGTFTPRQGKPLADCDQADTVIILRVSDGDPRRLQFLDRLGMHPGAAVEVIDKQPFEGPLTLRINSIDHAIGRELAGTVFVRSSEEEECRITNSE